MSDTLKENYYYDIDEMPLFNWRKCQEKQDYKYTRKDIKKGTEEEDLKAWDIIYDSYLSEFGLGSEYERILEIKTRIAELQCNLVIEDDRFLLNEIKRLERELNDILNRKTRIDRDWETKFT